MSINGIGLSDYSALWGKRKTQTNISGTNFAFHMADAQDTKTNSEIIIKPDGSRVLMITVEIGGMQTAMSLKISDPTDMQNDISKQKDSRSETPVNAAALTSNVISGSVGEE